jgi:hypothetical protein
MDDDDWADVIGDLLEVICYDVRVVAVVLITAAIIVGLGYLIWG